MGLGETPPGGVFPAGAWPYGALDMSGNVWEWTRSFWGRDWSKPDFKYPYDPNHHKREDLGAPNEALRVVRGCSFVNYQKDARCGHPYWNYLLN